jgi:hypothetical protein
MVPVSLHSAGRGRGGQAAIQRYSTSREMATLASVGAAQHSSPVGR